MTPTATSGTTDLYRPRSVEHREHWSVGPLALKVYGITAVGRPLTGELLDSAHAFVQSEVPPLVAAQGDDNGLGFVIIHPGELGVSVLAHWWVQGSVLCQHIRRTLYEAPEPLPRRPVIACVWELALINAEQTIWRETMMMTTHPDPATRVEMHVV